MQRSTGKLDWGRWVETLQRKTRQTDASGGGEFTHTSASEDEEEDEDGFNLVIEREVDDEGIYSLFVCCDTTLDREGIEGSRGVGECETWIGVRTYPEDPNGHDPFHVALALGRRPCARYATAAGRWKGDLEDLVGVVDIQE